MCGVIAVVDLLLARVVGFHRCRVISRQVDTALSDVLRGGLDVYATLNRKGLDVFKSVFEKEARAGDTTHQCGRLRSGAFRWLDPRKALNKVGIQ